MALYAFFGRKEPFVTYSVKIYHGAHQLPIVILNLYRDRPGSPVSASIIRRLGFLCIAATIPGRRAATPRSRSDTQLIPRGDPPRYLPRSLGLTLGSLPHLPLQSHKVSKIPKWHGR
jgi:hypothetical protein